MKSDANFKIRLAQSLDWEDIARIHVANWRQHYKGLVPQTYLDNEIVDDRKKVWFNRFAVGNPLMIASVIEKDEEMIGFVCSFLDHHAEYGAYLDNLHVLTEYQGHGLGKLLMKETGKIVEEMRPGSGVYLHVLKGNHSAMVFYEKIGGKRLREYSEMLPWGVEGAIVDYWWKAEELGHI